MVIIQYTIGLKEVMDKLYEFKYNLKDELSILENSNNFEEYDEEKIKIAHQTKIENVKGFIKEIDELIEQFINDGLNNE